MRQLTPILMLCAVFAVATKADVTSLKLDTAGRVIVNDQPARLWGLRVASAATSDESAKRLIDALKGYQSAGINLLLINYQGGPGGSARTYSADGKQFEDLAVRDRTRRILDAAASHDMLVVVTLFYPRQSAATGQDPRLLTRAAYLAACATAAAELKDRHNVLICVSDQILPGAFASCPMKFAPADVIDCLKAVAAVAPNLPRGGGSPVHDQNLTIAKSDAATVIFHLEPGAAPPRMPPGKPIIHCAFTAGGADAGRRPQGFFAPQARQPYLDMVERYADATTAHAIAHFPGWTEGAMDTKNNRFDEGGQGTQDDPGLAWYFNAVSKHARRHVPEVADTPKTPDKSIFDNPK